MQVKFEVSYITPQDSYDEVTIYEYMNIIGLLTVARFKGVDL